MKKLLDEEAIIKLLWSKLSGNGRDPFDDDVVWSENQNSKKMIISKSDMLVTFTDVPRHMSALQIARKSVVSCISDFAAKGVRPSFCLVSIGLPRKLSNAKFVSSLAAGFAAAQEEYGVKILGGDVNETERDCVIDCSGFAFTNKFVRRRDARIGDLVGTSGKFGHQAGGLLILKGQAKSVSKSFERKAVRSVLSPCARLDMGTKIARYLSSSTDSSDGLAISLYHLAESSGVSFELDYLPADDDLNRFANDNELSVNDLILFGGEEYELVFTFPPKYKSKLSKEGVITIGSVIKTRQGSKPQVYYRLKRVPRKGWLHLEGSSSS